MVEMVSLLPALEPVLGIAFALNLAYVGLPRFRYREAIRTDLSHELAVSFNGNEDRQIDLPWYRTLARLCGKTKTSSGKRIENGELPDGVWPKIYVMFEKRADRFLSISACVLLGFLVFFGVGHSIGRFTSLFGYDVQWLFGQTGAAWWLWGTLGLAFMPVVFVNSGNYVVKCAKMHSTKQISSILATMQANAQSAQLPTLALTADQPTSA